MAWSQIKGYIARNNTSFKLCEVKDLAKQAIKMVTAENWKQYIKHVLSIEEQFWKADLFHDSVAEKLIITTTDSDDNISGLEEFSDSE